MKQHFQFLLFALLMIALLPSCRSKQAEADLLAQLDASKASCVVRKDGRISHYHQQGVRDLYDLFTLQPSRLRGAHVADKIIGRGAAALMVMGQVEHVSTHVITTPALQMLRAAGVRVDYEEEIPFVENRRKTGQCPLDARLEAVGDSAHLALPMIEQFLEELSRDCSSVFAPPVGQ